MANTGEGGDSGTVRKPRRPPGGIGVYRRGPGGKPIPPPPGGTGSSTSGPGGTGSSGSGGGSGGGSSYAADAAAAKRKAANRYLEDAATLQQQINALKIALGSDGLRAALRIQLKNVFGDERTVSADISEAYSERVGSLKGSARDNEKELSGQSYLNLANRGRERANALSEATLQGAGESDVLAAQGASLRNWNANQVDVDRAYFDTLRGINTSLTDLTADTRQAQMQNAMNANSDRNSLWSDYYGNRSETLTQIGNVYGQQAEYYGLAKEQVDDKGTASKQTDAADKSGYYFRHAALMTGKTWKNPGVPKWIKNWEGAGPVQDSYDSTYHGPTSSQSGDNFDTGPKPEGATLREWAK